MLLADERIDFSAIKVVYDHLQDQVTRLLHTVEGTRRKLEEVEKERDELLQFKNQTVGFYSMMQRGISNFVFAPDATPPFPHTFPPNPFTSNQMLPSQQVVHADFKSSQTCTTPAPNTNVAVPSPNSPPQTVKSPNSTAPVSISARSSAELPPSDPISAPTNPHSSVLKTSAQFTTFVEPSPDQDELMNAPEDSVDASSSEMVTNELPPLSQRSIQRASFQPINQCTGGDGTEDIEDTQFLVGEAWKDSVKYKADTNCSNDAGNEGDSDSFWVHIWYIILKRCSIHSGFGF